MPDRCENLSESDRQYAGCYFDKDEDEWTTCRVGTYINAGRILACVKGHDGEIDVTLCQLGYRRNERGCCPNTHYYEPLKHTCVTCHLTC